MTLNDLKRGERASIVRWDTNAPPVRLLEMGVLPGTIIEMVRIAPLGDPIAIKVRGYQLSVRKTEAALLVVELC